MKEVAQVCEIVCSKVLTDDNMYLASRSYFLHLRLRRFLP